MRLSSDSLTRQVVGTPTLTLGGAAEMWNLGNVSIAASAIAFHVDKEGHRTGQTEIVQIETLPEDTP